MSVETEKTKEVVDDSNNDNDDDNGGDEKISSFTFDNKSTSENRKTIKIDNQ